MEQLDTYALRNWDTFIKDAALRTDDVVDEAIAQKVAECFIQNGMPTPRKALSATKKTFNKAKRMSSATFPKDTPGDLLMEAVTTRLEDFEDSESEEEVEEKPFADMSEEDDSLVQRRLLELEIKELVDDWHDTKKDLLKKTKPKWNDKLSVQHFCDVAVPTAVSEAALGEARFAQKEIEQDWADYKEHQQRQADQLKATEQQKQPADQSKAADAVEEVTDDVTGDDIVDTPDDPQQQKLGKPSRALAVIITTSCATVLATTKHVTQLWPRYKRGEIEMRELILAACSTAMITACMAGGIGGLLAILEEVAPEIAKSAGPLLLFGLCAVQAGRAIKDWYQEKITATEMGRRIGEVITQVGGGYGGAVVGMFVGSAFGPVGILIGGCIGGFLGAEIGAALFNWFWSGLEKVFGTRDFDYWIHNLKYKHRHHGHMVSLDSKVVQYLTEVYEGTMFSKKNGRQMMADWYEECNTQLERHFRQFALHTHRDHLPPGHTQADALAADAALIAAKDSVLALKAMMKEKFPRATIRGMRDQDQQIQKQDQQIQDQDQEIQRLKAQLELAQRTASCQRGQLRLRNSC